MSRHTYETVRGSRGLPVRVTFTFTPGDPGQLVGPPEKCHDGWGPEIEIEMTEIFLRPRHHAGEWCVANDDQARFIEDSISNDALIESAEDDLVAQREDAADHAHNVRQEMREEDDGR